MSGRRLINDPLPEDNPFKKKKRSCENRKRKVDKMSDIQKDVKLAPCPFCSCNQIDTILVNSAYKMKCSNDECEAEGPWKANKSEAVKLWNTRVPMSTPEQREEKENKLMHLEDRCGYLEGERKDLKAANAKLVEENRELSRDLDQLKQAILYIQKHLQSYSDQCFKTMELDKASHIRECIGILSFHLAPYLQSIKKGETR